MCCLHQAHLVLRFRSFPSSWGSLWALPPWLLSWATFGDRSFSQRIGISLSSWRWFFFCMALTVASTRINWFRFLNLHTWTLIAGRNVTSWDAPSRDLHQLDSTEHQDRPFHVCLQRQPSQKYWLTGWRILPSNILTKPVRQSWTVKWLYACGLTLAHCKCWMGLAC